jgi:isopenicillin N synthase-like dioxygenase
MLTRVPVIDVAPFLADEPEGKCAVVTEVGRACADIGFFTVIGHGVPGDLLDRMDRVSRAFFDLPLEEKLRVKRPRPEQSRGYIGIGDENLAASQGDRSTSDLKEFFAIGPVDVPEDDYHRRPEAYPSFAPNLWPERPAELRAAWTAYYRAMESLAGNIMQMFALALDLPQAFFRPYVDRHISGIRVINYPDQPEAPGARQLRAGSHTDYGAVTILKSENAPGGLQVLNRAGEWVDVVTAPGSFVCNIGDLMQRWTNDRWVSTVHRVVNPPRERALSSRRQSVVFFHQPNYDAVIECLPSCRGHTDPPRYEPVTSGGYRLQKFLRGVGAAPAPRGPAT